MGRGRWSAQVSGMEGMLGASGHSALGLQTQLCHALIRRGWGLVIK